MTGKPRNCQIAEMFARLKPEVTGWGDNHVLELAGWYKDLNFEDVPASDRPVTDNEHNEQWLQQVPVQARCSRVGESFCSDASAGREPDAPMSLLTSIWSRDRHILYGQRLAYFRHTQSSSHTNNIRVLVSFIQEIIQ